MITDLQLHARLDSLERARIRHLRIAVAVVVALVCGVMIAAGPTETSRIILKDAQGLVRYKIEVTTDGSIVQTFIGKDGAERIKTFIDAEGIARQRFYDEEKVVRASIYAFPTRHKQKPAFAGIGVLGPSGKAAIIMEGDNEIGVAQRYIDSSGKVRMVSGVNPDRFAYHAILDENSIERVTAFTAPGDMKGFELAAGFSIRDKEQNNRASIITTKDNTVHQTLFGADQKPRITSEVTADGKATFSADKSVLEQFLSAVGISPAILESLRLLADK